MRQRIIFTLAVALIAPSCQKKAEGQTVAIVNGEEITASDLNAELTSENASLSGTTKEARAAALQNLIDRRLLAQQARSEGLDKTPDFLNQQRRATEDLLIRMLVTRQASTAQTPSADQVNQFEASRPGMFANRESWTLDQLVFPLQKDPGVLAKLKAAKTLDEVSQVLTSSGVQYTKASRKIDTAVLPPSIYAQLSHLQPNEPFIVPGPDKQVANVITAREPAPLPADQTRTLALNAMKQSDIQKSLQDRVKSLKASAKVEYQPGFAPPAKK